MPSHDYHPLRLRSVLPGSAHLALLEARAAARNLPSPVAADVQAYLAEIRHLLEERALARGERPDADLIGRTAVDEALRISKALQWARSGNRVVRVPSGGPPGNPARGTLQVGGIQLPTACVYVAFSDDFPGPDPRTRIAGVYLGEGGSLEALAAGWVEQIWALPIVVPRSGDALGSAAASWHAAIGTADPARRVCEVLSRSFAGNPGAKSTSSIHFEHAVLPPPEWHGALIDAIECALQAAALASVAAVVPRTRSSAPDLPIEGIVLETVADEDLEDPRTDAQRTGNEGSPRPRTFIDVVFGPAPPIARNRWLVEREPLQVAGGRDAGKDRRRTSPRTDDAPTRRVTGHDRGEHDRTYHRNTPRQFTKRIPAHPVNGGRPKIIAHAVVVDRLDPQRRTAPSPN